jgi:hypothetical protein
MASSNPETLLRLLERRLSRRRLIGDGAGLLALAALPLRARSADTEPRPLAFTRVAPSKADAVIVPDGYRAQVVLRWGDPLFDGVAPLDARRVPQGALLEQGAARAQAGQFGCNCDGIGLFPLDDERLLMCVNHEFPSPALLFPGWTRARRLRRLGRFVSDNAGVVPVMQAAVGLSVIELEAGSAWRFRVGSRYNRRITAHSRLELTGPARGHALLTDGGRGAPMVAGTLGNCAAGTTPWGTYLTAEENVDDFFGNAAAAQYDPAVARAHARFEVRERDSSFRWEYVDPRFDAAANPREVLKFGWVVELDPFDPGSTPKKRTALGRLKHEGATAVLAGDGRVVVYMGDDEQFEYFYKFVSSGRFDPARPERSRDLLDSGTLYVARFADDGTGRWLPLVWREQAALSPAAGFESQGDVVLRCREAADRLGATPLDRPEDVAVSPKTGKVYVACTQNIDRGSGLHVAAGRQVDAGPQAGSPRAPNRAGHIIELTELGSDATAEAFRWEVFLLAGAPETGDLLASLPAGGATAVGAEATYFGGQHDARELSAFANPDNLTFDAAGNLWIVTDGTQPGGNNNGCFACPTEGEFRGRVRQFMSGPIGAEICGCELTAEGGTLFLTVQHPGAGGSAEQPTSHWPDGGDAAPRSSVVAIAPVDRARKVGE